MRHAKGAEPQRGGGVGSCSFGWQCCSVVGRAWCGGKWNLGPHFGDLLRYCAATRSLSPGATRADNGWLHGKVPPELRLISAGDRHLRALLARSMMALPSHAAYSWHLHSQPRRTFGSCCSGSDSEVLALRAVQEAAQETFGVDGEFEHKLSAEFSKRKRDFLLHVLGDEPGPPALYGDCTELHGKASPYDYRNKRHMAVEPVDWVFWGFPCQDVSALCEQRTKHREAFMTDMSASPKTGKVFENGVLQFAEKHRCVLLLENVLGLAVGSPSPLDRCVQELAARQMHVTVFSLSPAMFGFPIDRPRLWLHCVPLEHLHGLPPHSVDRILQHSIELCAQNRETELAYEHTLLPDDHPSLVNLRERCKDLPFVVFSDATTDQSQKLKSGRGSSGPSSTWSIAVSRETARGMWTQSHLKNCRGSSLLYASCVRGSSTSCGRSSP